jgi:hypothetical protein
MLLHDLENRCYHPLLILLGFVNGIKGEVLIDPNFTEALLVHTNHVFGNCKRPEPIVKSLKSNENLF